jgi:hypothetical protein
MPQNKAGNLFGIQPPEKLACLFLIYHGHYIGCQEDFRNENIMGSG